MQYLVLRPESKCRQTCEFLTAAGIDCVGIPLMKTVALDDALQRIQAVVSQLQADDIVLVTSTVTGAQISASLQQCYAQKAGFKTYAIGASSAKSLNLSNELVSVPDIETSEGLLALLSSHRIDPKKQGQKIYIFKGVGGRDLLHTELLKQGFSVIEVNTYKRAINNQWVATVPWQHHNIDCALASSGELLDAAFSDTKLCSDWLRSLPWVVVSRRMAKRALQMGIKRVFVSDGASNAAFLAAINKYSGELHD